MGQEDMELLRMVPPAVRDAAVAQVRTLVVARVTKTPQRTGTIFHCATLIGPFSNRVRWCGPDWCYEKLVTGPTHHKDDPLLLEQVRRSIGRQAHLF